MGDNTLTTRTDGETIPAADHNEIVQALRIDHVPRNNSNAPEDIIGQIGTSLYRWLRGYLKEIFVGTAANNLKIYEGTSGELWLERNSASDETVRVGVNTIEMWINGSEKASFDDTTLSTVDKYIDHDSLKTKAKINVGVFDHGATGANYDTIFTTTLNSCVAGKELIIHVSHWTESEASDAVDWRIKINGNTEEDYPNDIPNGPLTEMANKIFSYTIPSDGNYTVLMEMRDSLGTDHGTYRVEEI